MAEKSFTEDIGGVRAVFTVLSGDTVGLGDSESPAVPEDVRSFSVPGSVDHGGRGYTVVSVSDWAFRGCKQLAHIDIPESVDSVGDCAFYGCAKLCEVGLPGIERVGDHMFCGCSSLGRVTVPASVREVDPGAFDGCTSLESIDADPGNPVYSSSDGVLFTKDGSGLIRYPPGRPGDVYAVPEGTLSLGEESFSDTVSLRTLHLPGSVEDIDTHALYRCPSLSRIETDGSGEFRSVDGVLFSSDGSTLIRYPPQREGTSYTVPEGTEYVGYWAFAGCEKLRNVEFGPGLVCVCDFAFAGCTSLEGIDIPKGTESLGWGAFNGCTSLEEVSLPKRVELQDDTFDHGFTDGKGRPARKAGGHSYRYDPGTSSDVPE